MTDVIKNQCELLNPVAAKSKIRLYVSEEKLQKKFVLVFVEINMFIRKKTV